jgi:SAM-dependent methyltransferase
MRLYSDLADWWPLFSDPADYADEADWILRAFEGALGRRPREILELGSGGGNTASHIIPMARMTLVDLNEEMLEVSRRLNPAADHIAGDMRSVRLGKSFDAVLIHDAIDYMLTPADLVAALTTARAHLAPGGVVVVLPDHVAETFAPSVEAGGHDAADGGRAVRFLEWTHPVRDCAAVYDVDFAILLRDEDGGVEVVHDRHTHGLFSRSAWSDAFVAAGLGVPQVRTDPWHREVFIARAA